MKIFLKKVSHRIRESLSLAALGDGLSNRISLFLRLLLRSQWRSIVMHLRANGTPFLFKASTHEELMLLYEIFCRRMYDFSSVRHAEYIVDCGANCGISSLFLHTLYPSARILAVEPNPTLFPRLQEVVRSYKNILPVQCAVGGREGTVRFFVSPHTTVASSLVQRAVNDKEYVVTMKTLEKLMYENNFPRIDALKFDIEGAEYDLFSRFSKLDVVDSFSGEVHEDLMGVSVTDFTTLFVERFHISLTPTGKKGRYIIHGHTTHNN